MPSPFLQPQRLRDDTNISVEIFVVSFTILPFLVLAYFYPLLPERIPLFMNLNGEVAVWGSKNWLSVFRVPLMAAITQVFCLLMKQSVLQSIAALSVKDDDDFARLHKQSAMLSLGLWDGFRCIAAFKMSAASFDMLFLSIERFNFLSKPAFILTFMAALLSIPLGLFYSYRWLTLQHKIKERFGSTKIQKPVDASRVYGGVVYFNPSDSALFVSKYIFNFANKWVYAFIACLIAYPLLVFLPT